MIYDFDEIIDRRPTDCAKWNLYDPDVIALWVADMDFRSPQTVIEALRCRVDHGIFGYGMEPPELRPLLQERLQHLYGWRIDAEALVFVPGVVVGFNLAAHAVVEPGDDLLAQTPVYYPILHVPDNTGCNLSTMKLTPPAAGNGQYQIDLDAFEAAIGPRTRLFILCNPHNPVGRVFTREELEAMAEICLRRDVVICSDEIHCDLVFPGHRHLPIASLDPEIEARTITLMAPSKTYNIAGLHASVAIIPNPELRKRFLAAMQGIVPRLDIMGFAAMLAAYQVPHVTRGPSPRRPGESEPGTGDDPWLEQVLRYLEANRDLVFDTIQEMPGLSMTRPEGTYLAWIDCREAGLEQEPGKFFLEKARVGLNEGAQFGPGGEGYVRLNFGCPRATLVEALDRMRTALEAR